jgi:hemerythrin-like domain-containing protein
MAGDQPGLKKRLGQEARRISSQHEQLDSLFGLVADAVDREERVQARDAFVRFQDALDAHFSLEESMYFPALHGLRPALSAELRELVREHGVLREVLFRVGRLLGDSVPLPECARELDRLADQLADHESREELLVGHVTGARA